MNKLIVIGLLFTMCLLCVSAFAEDPEPPGGCIPSLRVSITPCHPTCVMISAAVSNYCILNTSPLYVSCSFSYEDEIVHISVKDDSFGFKNWGFICNEPWDHYFVLVAFECSWCSAGVWDVWEGDV